MDSLENLCNYVISQKISGCQLQCLLEKIDAEGKEKVAECMPLNVPTDLALSLFLSETYWQRKCLYKHWTYVDYWLHFCNWKSTYVSHDAEELIDNFIGGKISFPELKTLLSNYRDHLLTLKINAFKLKYFNENFQEFTARNDIPLEDYILKLVRMFPHLKEIYLNNLPINYDLVFDLEGNLFSDHSFKNFCRSLSKTTTLQKVSLIGACMELLQFRVLVDSLKALSNLVDLNLSCNLISDAMCECIVELLRDSKLEKLILSNNCIGNGGARLIGSILCKKISLNSLFLDKNAIEDTGAIYLAENLVSNTCLQKLDLSNNRISAKAAPAISMLLKNNSMLDFLNLSGNYLGQEAGAEIRAAVACNDTVKFLNHQFCGFTEDDEDEINLHVSHNFINNQ